MEVFGLLCCIQLVACIDRVLKKSCKSNSNDILISVKSYAGSQFWTLRELMEYDGLTSIDISKAFFSHFVNAFGVIFLLISRKLPSLMVLISDSSKAA